MYLYPKCRGIELLQQSHGLSKKVIGLKRKGQVGILRDAKNEVKIRDEEKIKGRKNYKRNCLMMTGRSL